MIEASGKVSSKALEAALLETKSTFHLDSRSLVAMDEVDYSPHCPHGRPVLMRMSRAEIEKRFGRT